MPVRSAVIDMGTNTFHLLVSEGTKALLEERRPVRVGMGGINRCLIAADAQERAMACMMDYARLAKGFGVEKIRAIATSAFRNASNGAEVAQQIQDAAGIEIKIIDGDEEARLIWEGIRSGMSLGSVRHLIVDIGGGSVEFSVCDGEEIFWKRSLEIGGQRLMELFQETDPIQPDHLRQMEDYLDQQLSVVGEALRHHRPEVLIGASGSFDTFSEIHCHREGIAYMSGPETPITLLALNGLLEEMIAKDRQQRMAIPGMISLRVDMIVAASVLIRRLMALYPFARLRVSGYSLKEGVRATML